MNTYYLLRVLRLALLAPTIVCNILNGYLSDSEARALLKPFPIESGSAAEAFGGKT